MAVCFAADCKHINRKDNCRFFRFPSNTEEYKNWEDYLSNFNSPPHKKRNDISDRHCKENNLVNRTVSFENELVPLNGRIGGLAEVSLSGDFLGGCIFGCCTLVVRLLLVRVITNRTTLCFIAATLTRIRDKNTRNMENSTFR